MLKKSHFSCQGQFVIEYFLMEEFNAKAILCPKNFRTKFNFDDIDEVNKVITDLGYTRLFNNTYYGEGIYISVQLARGYYDDDDNYVAEEGVNIHVTHTEAFDIESFYKQLEFIKRPAEVEQHCPIVSFLGQQGNGNGFYLQTKKLAPVELDIENSYHTDFPLSKTIELVKGNKSGLFVFKGIPGSGKSFFLKWLCQESGKTFLYISISEIELLLDSRFNTFAFANLQNAVIVIEDAEKVLEDRKTGSSYFTSLILNLTSGVFGDILNCQIICTLNTDDNMDKALLRKGRLLAAVNFDLLPVEKANVIKKSLGVELDITAPIALTEIYNWEDNQVEQKRNKLGF